MKQLIKLIKSKLGIAPSTAAAGLAAVALVGAAATAPTGGGGDRCNGHAELCAKRIDQVTFAATHNSMSAKASPGWQSVEQSGDIPDQLKAGVRGLLIDTVYGYPHGSGVCTDFGRHEIPPDPETKEQGKAGSEAAATVQKSASALGRIFKCVRTTKSKKPHPQSRIYLCHKICEKGATDFELTLRSIASFLTDNPREVLMIIIQDATTPKDIEADFKRSGLYSLVYRTPLQTPLPTLAELIGSDQRVIVATEKVTGPATPWLQSFKSLFQDTPYSCEFLTFCRLKLHRPSQCKLLRGDKTSPLFLVNHWMSFGLLEYRTSDARSINAKQFLLKRIREACRTRIHQPNMIAVNFYEQGDLMAVVDELNGVR